MTKFSRKKIRGFKRKIKQLESWKNSILNYPIRISNRAPISFRIHLRPFYWFKNENPSIYFHNFIYKAFEEIFLKLKNDEWFKTNSLDIQLWLFYPRTIKSIIIVGSKEQNDKKNVDIEAKSTNLNPPTLFNRHFDNCVLKVGKDVNFEQRTGDDGTLIWTSHEKGNIWIIS
ncbi:MAG: hypothetical protein EOO44_09570 [Flavobacterium sp.]|nr:MAG: hypothetical protein EOO44_09570 [Flavobacterium sp.]